MATFDPSVATGPVSIGGEVSDNDEFIEQLGMLADIGRSTALGVNYLSDAKLRRQQAGDLASQAQSIEEAVPILAKKYNKSPEAIRALLKAGKLTGDDLLAFEKERGDIALGLDFLTRSPDRETLKTQNVDDFILPGMGVPTTTATAPIMGASVQDIQPNDPIMANLIGQDLIDPATEQTIVSPEASAGETGAPANATAGASSVTSGGGPQAYNAKETLEQAKQRVQANSEFLLSSIPENEFERYKTFVAESISRNPEAAEAIAGNYAREFLTPESFTKISEVEAKRRADLFNAIKYPDETLKTQQETLTSAQQAATSKSLQDERDLNNAVYSADYGNAGLSRKEALVEEEIKAKGRSNRPSSTKGGALTPKKLLDARKIFTTTIQGGNIIQADEEIEAAYSQLNAVEQEAIVIKYTNLLATAPEKIPSFMEKFIKMPKELAQNVMQSAKENVQED